jgi:hypothetical protein
MSEDLELAVLLFALTCLGIAAGLYLAAGGMP